MLCYYGLEMEVLLGEPEGCGIHISSVKLVLKFNYR